MMLQTLAAVTFALWVTAWLAYSSAWHWAAPRRRVYWIAASAACTVLASLLTAGLFVALLLS